MIIGLDLDNTIACYDRAFEFLAEKLGGIPENISKNKESIKDYFLSVDDEAGWTRFQGELYGPGMRHATVYPGSLRSIEDLLEAGHSVSIISHRTKYPYSGQNYDLHAYGRDWVDKNLSGVIKDVTFHETKKEKLAHIASLRCDFFLDDLISVLSDRNFPISTKGVLFSPAGLEPNWVSLSITDWRQLLPLVENCVFDPARVS